MLFSVKSPFPGFEDVKSVEFSELDNFFVRMTTKDRDADKDPVALTLVNPYAIRQNYDFVVPTAIQALLDLKQDGELKVYCVVVLNKTIENSCVNFLAPVVCNMKNGTIAQVLLDAKEYPSYGLAEKIGVLIKNTEFSVKSPILGFEDITKVEILPVDQVLATMKSVESSKEHEKTSFTLINPYFLRRDYEFELPTPYKVLLDINETSELKIFNVVILNKTIEESSVNFLAPIVCNAKNNTLAQVVLDPKNYPKYGPFEKVGDLVKKK